jgi:hypothetical protein
VVFSAVACYPTTSAAQVSRFVTAVAALADDVGVPLSVDVRPDGVTVDSGKDQWEDDGYGSRDRFTDLAGRIQAAAHELGLAADPGRARFTQLGIDAVGIPAVRAFWASVLGYRYDPRPGLTDIFDPRRLNPEIIFQQMDAADEDRRRQRNRIRVELCIPLDRMQDRLDAALAAGGQVVDERTGRCRLADPEGNELDIVSQR